VKKERERRSKTGVLGREMGRSVPRKKFSRTWGKRGIREETVRNPRGGSGPGGEGSGTVLSQLQVKDIQAEIEGESTFLQ